jgi:DNA topoisomerase VI subunit A
MELIEFIIIVIEMINQANNTTTKPLNQNRMEHINEIKIDGEGKWNKQFNLCSELFMKAQDESLTEEERKNYLDKWFEERQRLELGIY